MAAPDAGPRQEDQPDGRIRVAIADDDDMSRDVLADLLRSDPGLEVVGLARDAREALEVIRDAAPQVVLLDVRMPGGGGPAVAEAVAGAPGAPRLLAISARDNRDAVVEMLAAGAVGYLIKGGPIDEILEAVRRASRGDLTLSPLAGRRLIGAVTERAEEDARREEAAAAALARIEGVLAGVGLDVAFQPILELGELKALGFEALARFSAEPRRGPAEWFFEAAEVGLEVELELRAVEVALGSAAALPNDSARASPFVAVNASPTTICDPRFTELLAGHTGNPLVVEVTEHGVVSDYIEFRRAFRRLRTAGTRLAVDDAGAGFASLRHILNLEPDMIKLDLALTRDIDRDPARRAMAKALVSFAQERDTTVIAEGIETEKELEALRQLGVPAGQGYHLGRPTVYGEAQ